MNVLSVQGLGALYVILLLLICIIVVFGVKLALIGYRTLKKKLPPEPPKKPDPKPEPVYYIVEKKQKRTKPKTQYATPKEIKFK